jgi:hypothetical protein
VNF